MALAVFAALVGPIALAVTGQLLARQLTIDSAELPVLRALELTRAQLQGTIAWEATALAAAALLIGVPAGVVAGRLAWTAFATEAGVAAGATVDLALVPLTIPATLLLANVIAAWPGRAAARVHPAIVLRTE